MRRTRGIIQRHKAHSGRYEAAPCDEWRIWRYLLGDQPSKPLFRSIWHLEAAAPTCQRQRSYEAVTVPVFETVSHPRLAVGDTTSSTCQQLDVAKRCLIWASNGMCHLEGHIARTTLCGWPKGRKSRVQRRRRRIETRLPPPASHPRRRLLSDAKSVVWRAPPFPVGFDLGLVAEDRSGGIRVTLLVQCKSSLPNER